MQIVQSVSGRTYLLEEKKGEIVSIGLMIQLGGMNGIKPGLAHCLEHMIVNTLSKKLDTTICDVNGITTKDYMLFYIRTLQSYVKNACILFMSSLQEKVMILPEEMRIIEQEIKRKENSIHDLLDENLYGGLFEEAELLEPITGKRQELYSYEQADVDDAMEHIRSIQTQTISIVAENPYLVFDMLESNVGTITSRDLVEYKNRQCKEDISSISMTHDQKMTYLHIGYSVHPKDKVNIDAFYIAALLIKDGAKNSLLKYLRDQKGYLYNLSVNYAAHLRRGLFKVSMACPTEFAFQVIEEYFTVSNYLLSGPFSSGEIDNAIRAYLFQQTASRESSNYCMYLNLKKYMFSCYDEVDPSEVMKASQIIREGRIGISYSTAVNIHDRLQEQISRHISSCGRR